MNIKIRVDLKSLTKLVKLFIFVCIWLPMVGSDHSKGKFTLTWHCKLTELRVQQKHEYRTNYGVYSLKFLLVSVGTRSMSMFW